MAKKVSFLCAEGEEGEKEKEGGGLTQLAMTTSVDISRTMSFLLPGMR